MKIDVVMPVLNGNDKHWLRDYTNYLKTVDTHTGDASISRYRDWDFLRYSLRSISDNMTFVDKVILAMYDEHQIPDWLDLNCNKLKIVFHKDILPTTIIPTYNSLAVSPYLWSADCVSEYFINFNDDYFVGKPLSETDFFENGKCVRSEYSLKTRTNFTFDNWTTDTWKHIILSTKHIRETYFDDKKYYVDTHVPLSMKKSAMLNVMSKLGTMIEYEYSKNTSKIRSNTNFLAHYIAAWTVIDNNDFVIHNALRRQMCNVCEHTDFASIMDACLHADLFCINDQFYSTDIDKFKDVKAKCIKILNAKFPNKSPFEK